jgi:tetratricopeptide (TPR) repeat protein
VAVVAGVASAAVWQVRLDRLTGAARTAELEKAEKIYTLPGPAREGGVAQLLRPEEEVVSFWPRPELDVLFDWVNSLRPVAVQLVTGDGGTGKTRLARQLAGEVAEIGWRTRWVPAGTEQEAAGMARDAGEPVLLVVDYAETRAGLPELLAEVTSDADGPNMRVLLLARSAGEWWQQLISSSEYRPSELLAAVRPITLGPVSGRSGQPEVFRQALAAFAGKLGAECPDAEIMLADPHAIVLVIHAAALLAVLDHSSAGRAAGAPGTKAAALAGLLRHEARYWQHSQAARGLGLDVDVARRVVAAGCLVGADDQVSAIDLLAAVADLADPARRGKVARWLHDLYPVPQTIAGEQEWIGSLQPDLIAEQLVVRVLAQHPELMPALFRELTGKRATRALTVLARAALADPVAGHQLDVAFTSDLEHLAVPALAVAVETNPAVGDRIRNALASSMPSAEVLERIADALPYPSFTLAETAAVVLQQLAEESAGDTEKHAHWLVGLGNWLPDLGRREEALAAVEEAVTAYRPLAEARPDAFLPDLAMSLNNLADILAALKREPEADAARIEAVELRRGT